MISRSRQVLLLFGLVSLLLLSLLAVPAAYAAEAGATVALYQGATVAAPSSVLSSVVVLPYTAHALYVWQVGTGLTDGTVGVWLEGSFDRVTWFPITNPITTLRANTDGSLRSGLTIGYGAWNYIRANRTDTVGYKANYQGFSSGGLTPTFNGAAWVLAKASGGGGVARPPYTAAVGTSASSLVVLGVTHAQNTAALVVDCLGPVGGGGTAPALVRVASSPGAGQYALAINPTTFDVSLTFASGGNAGGACTINGGGSPGTNGTNGLSAGYLAVPVGGATTSGTYQGFTFSVATTDNATYTITTTASLLPVPPLCYIGGQNVEAGSFDGTTLVFTSAQGTGTCYLPMAGAAGGNAVTILNQTPAASATIDTTNAANITSNTLPVGRLPALGGDVTCPAGTGSCTVGKVNGTPANGAPLRDGDGLLFNARTGSYDARQTQIVQAGLLAEYNMVTPNLIQQSNSFSTSPWINNNVVLVSGLTAPDGTATAWSLTGTTTNAVHSITQQMSQKPPLPATILYTETSTVRAKANGYNFLVLYASDGSNYFAYFNLAAGTVGTVNAGLTASIASLGGGWYQCSITRTIVNNGSYFAFGAASADNTYSYPGDGVSGVLLWHAQVNGGSAATAYAASTTNSQLTDASGNGNHGTFGAGGNAPAFLPVGTYFYNPGNNYITLPSALTGQIKTVQIIADSALGTWPAGNNGFLPLFSSTTTAGATLFANPNLSAADSPYPSVYYNNAEITRVNSGCLGVCDYAMTFDANVHVFVNGSEPSYYQITGAANTSAGGPYLLGYAPGYSRAFNGIMYYVLIYNRVLTTQEIIQNRLAVKDLLQRRGVDYNLPPLRDADNKLYAIGDSITAGGGFTPYTASLSALTDTFTIYNLGINGSYLHALRASYQGMAASLIPSGLGGTGTGRAVAVVFAGTNDLSILQGVVPTFADLVSLGKSLRAAGLQVVVVPMFSRTGTGVGGLTMDVLHDSYNALITSTWPTFADAIVDPARYPFFYADGAYANPGAYSTSCNGGACFQPDGIHPLTGGSVQLGAMVAEAVNSISSRAGKPYVQATDPGCTVSWQYGRVWIDPTAATTVEKHCGQTGGSSGWITK